MAVGWEWRLAEVGRLQTGGGLLIARLAGWAAARAVLPRTVFLLKGEVHGVQSPGLQWCSRRQPLCWAGPLGPPADRCPPHPPHAPPTPNFPWPLPAQQADIIIAACGRAEMVAGDWVKPGAAVIDVGINAVDVSPRWLLTVLLAAGCVHSWQKRRVWWPRWLLLGHSALLHSFSCPAHPAPANGATAGPLGQARLPPGGRRQLCRGEREGEPDHAGPRRRGPHVSLGRWFVWRGIGRWAVFLGGGPAAQVCGAAAGTEAHRVSGAARLGKRQGQGKKASQPRRRGRGLEGRAGPPAGHAGGAGRPISALGLPHRAAGPSPCCCGTASTARRGHFRPRRRSDAQSCSARCSSPRLPQSATLEIICKNDICTNKQRPNKLGRALKTEVTGVGSFFDCSRLTDY